jgi:hypothetical protein
MKYTVLIFLLLIVIGINANAQNEKSYTATLINFSYGLQLPGGDLANDFNANFNFGGGVQYLTKNKWLFGAKTYFIFGNDPKIDVLGNLRTAEGEIVNQDRTFAVVFMEQRGYHVGLTGGKIFPISKKHPNSGILVTLTAGFLQHKIRIEDRTGGLPQIAGEYLKGYDRLTNGFALTEFIGYQHLSNNGRINFFAGLEFTQGFTQNRRSWDYFTQQRLDDNRLDLLSGLKVGWTLPLVGDTYDADDIFY